MTDPYSKLKKALGPGFAKYPLLPDDCRERIWGQVCVTSNLLNQALETFDSDLTALKALLLTAIEVNERTQHEARLRAEWFAGEDTGTGVAS
jgi:hypothetical protein